MSHPTHITTGGKTARSVARHPLEIEREKREAAHMLLVVWPEIERDATVLMGAEIQSRKQ